jgi:hypothetical protein
MPENGWSSSRIRKIAAETDSAQITSDAKVVALAGAIREKPANKTIIQSSRTAKKGLGIVPSSRTVLAAGEGWRQSATRDTMN